MSPSELAASFSHRVLPIDPRRAVWPQHSPKRSRASDIKMQWGDCIKGSDNASVTKRRSRGAYRCGPFLAHQQHPSRSGPLVHAAGRCGPHTGFRPGAGRARCPRPQRPGGDRARQARDPPGQGRRTRSFAAVRARGDADVEMSGTSKRTRSGPYPPRPALVQAQLFVNIASFGLGNRQRNYVLSLQNCSQP
jgi:hypothetical protein